MWRSLVEDPRHPLFGLTRHAARKEYLKLILSRSSLGSSPSSGSRCCKCGVPLPAGETFGSLWPASLGFVGFEVDGTWSIPGPRAPSMTKPSSYGSTIHGVSRLISWPLLPEGPSSSRSRCRKRKGIKLRLMPGLHPWQINDGTAWEDKMPLNLSDISRRHRHHTHYHNQHHNSMHNCFFNLSNSSDHYRHLNRDCWYGLEGLGCAVSVDFRLPKVGS